MTKLQEIEQQHMLEFSNNNWKDNDKTVALAKAFKQHNRAYCLECGVSATVTCQYH